MDIDLNAVLSDSSAFIDRSQRASQDINTIVRQGNDINEARQRVAVEAGNAAQVKVQTELGEVARQEASRQAIAARMGTDPSKVGWIIGQKADEIKVADAGLAQASAAIKEKDSVSFLQNPLGWLQNQLTINDDIANYNYFARQKNRAEETALQLERLTQASFQTSNALSATTSEAYVGAMKVLGAFQYQANALDAAAQGARWNMEGIVAATNADRDRLQVMYSANNAVMQEKHYQTELAKLKLSLAEFNLRKQAHDEKAGEDSLILKYISNGYFNMTGKPMDQTTASQALVLYKSKHPDAIAMFESGLASSKITGGESNKPVISLSPYKSSDLVGQGKVTNMSPAMTQVGEQLVSWRRSFENPAVQNAYPYDPKDKNSKEVAFNKYVEDQKRLTLGNVTPDSVFAPYPIQKVAQLNKNISNLPIWKNVLEPASKTGVDINDPNIAFGVVTAAMQQGKLSYPDALDLSLMYAAGLDLNNQTRNFIAFGISPVKSYNTSVSVPGTFGKTTINMVDQRTLATALNKAEAIQAQYRMENQTRGLGVGPQPLGVGNR